MVEDLLRGLLPGPWLKPYQPSQRYIVVDERHVGAEDLPGRAVLGLEQSRTPRDVMGVAALLAKRLRDPRDDGPKRAFTDRVWRLAGQFEPGDVDSRAAMRDDGLKRAFTDWVWRLAGQFEPGDADSRAAMRSGSPPSGTRV